MRVNALGRVHGHDAYQEIDMSPQLSPAQRQQLGADLQARRNRLDSQRSAYLDGSSRAEHARDLLLQDGDDASQRDAEREVDFARTDRTWFNQGLPAEELKDGCRGRYRRAIFQLRRVHESIRECGGEAA